MAWNTVTFNQDGGTGGETRTIYAQYSTSGSYYTISYYATAQSTSTEYRITSVNVPTKPGKIFAGYRNESGIRYVSPSGSLVKVSYASSLPGSLKAVWLDYTIVSIGKNGGTGGTSTVYRRLSDGKLFADTALTQEIIGISVPSKIGYVFNGATYNGIVVIDANGLFTDEFREMTITAAEITATAQWTQHYSTRGVVDDYFGLSSDSIIPISSNNGDGKRRVCVANATVSGSTQSNAGRYTSGVDYTSGVWRNPTVTYRIISDCTVAVQLGKAFAATVSGSSMSITGYMIVSAEIETKIGEFPTLTVSSVANEGADAINLFNVSVNVEGAAHAQVLMNAISGSCVLQSSKLIAKCDPVVCTEDGMPCASDVVKGRLLFGADVIAQFGDDTISAGNGFVEIGKTKADQDSIFRSFNFSAQKEIV